MAKPLRLTLVDRLSGSGDQRYRRHQSAAALAPQAYERVRPIANGPSCSRPPRP